MRPVLVQVGPHVVDVSRAGAGELAPEWEASREAALDQARHELHLQRQARTPTAERAARVPRDYAALAHAAKERGNALFRAGDDARAAAYHYRLALHYARRCADRDALERSLRLPCYLNMAACDLHADDPEAAKRHARRALKIDPYSAKALFRKAEAERRMGDVDAAVDDLEKAATLAPEDAAVRRALEAANAQRDRAAREEVAMAARMFGGKRG